MWGGASRFYTDPTVTTYNAIHQRHTFTHTISMDPTEFRSDAIHQRHIFIQTISMTPIEFRLEKEPAKII